MGIFDKGVKKTNLNFFQKLGRAIVGKSKVDDDGTGWRRTSTCPWTSSWTSSATRSGSF